MSKSISGLILLVITASLPLNFAAAVLPLETDSAMAFLEILSDPELFSGRKSGAPGGDDSQLWVAERFFDWDMEPLEVNLYRVGNQFLIPFRMLSTIEKGASLTLKDSRWGAIEFLLGDDYTVCTNSGTGNVEAKVTVVGHGLSKPSKGWDDYHDVDVEGKVVVIYRGIPDNHEDWTSEYSRTYTFSEAVRRGAAAVLFHQGEFPVHGAAIIAEASQSDIPAGYIGDRILQHLFHGSGQTLKSYKKRLETAPFPLELEKTIGFETEIDRLERSFGFNVAGVVRGRHPGLSTEAIIVGAHGDHIGTNSLGHVYPGADDNASGSAVVLELARHFSTNPQDRTLIFCIFGAEEQGLLGSGSLVERLPGNYNYVCMINLDMVGRGEGVTVIGGGDQLHEISNPWYVSLPDSLREKIAVTRAWGSSSSDHASFRDEGIPAFTVHSRGDHNYHHSTDDQFYTIDRQAIDGVLHSVASWIEAVGMYPQQLADKKLTQRTVWHRGYGLSWLASSGDIISDIDSVKARLASGYTASIVTLPFTDSIEDDALFLNRLNEWNDRIAQDEKISCGKNYDDIYTNSYQSKATLFLALNGDNLSNSDSTYWAVCGRFGVNWIVLNDLSLWLKDGELRPERSRLIGIWADSETIVQLPMDQIDAWSPVVERLKDRALIIGTWDDLSRLSDEQLQDMHDLGSCMAISVQRDQLPAVAEKKELINRYKLHVLPAESGYDETLDWIGDLQQIGLETDEIIQWIGGNLRLW